MDKGSYRLYAIMVQKSPIYNNKQSVIQYINVPYTSETLTETSMRQRD